jgi:hypothetical protein
MIRGRLVSGAMIKLAESINRSIVDESNIFFGKLWFESIISEKNLSKDIRHYVA